MVKPIINILIVMELIIIFIMIQHLKLINVKVLKVLNSLKIVMEAI